MNLIRHIERYMPYRAFNFSVDISLQHKFVYVEVPKAACSTIRRRLIDRETAALDVTPTQLHPNIFSSCFVKPFQLSETQLEHVLFSGEYFRFSFVREPRARLLSAYLEKICQKKDQLAEILSILNMEVSSLESSPDISLVQFVDAVEATPPKKRNKHWREQHLLLMDGWLELDFIGRVEQFERDWKTVARQIGLKRRLRLNAKAHAVGASGKLDDYLDTALRARVDRIYARDFERFDYSP